MKPTSSQSPSEKVATICDPLGDYPQQFQKHLECLHYRPSTIEQYAHCINILARQMKAQSVDLSDLNGDRAVDLIARSKHRSFGNKKNAYIIRHFVKFLTALGATKPVLEVASENTARGRLKRGYEDYLRCQRGLSERTIFHCWRIADRFLEFRFGKEVGDLSQITSTDIVGFLQLLTTRTPPLREKCISSHLRNFFRYLFKDGKTTVNLALSIPSVAQRYGTRLPRHLTPEHVDILVRAVRTDSVVGRRNYAMVLLLARLGLRAPEVVAMQLDDIDWRSGEIIVRGKGNRHDRVPLPPDVGEALADYIKCDRKTASRTLFVTAAIKSYGPFAYEIYKFDAIPDPVNPGCNLHFTLRSRR